MDPLRLALLLVAVILFIVAAIPVVPYAGTLQNAGLAAFAGSFAVGGF